MKRSEIEKALYIEKPMAKLMAVGHKEPDPYYWYCAKLNSGAIVSFKVFESEMGGTEFGEEIEGQLLRRWLVNAYTFIESDKITQRTLEDDQNVETDTAEKVGTTMNDANEVLPSEDVS